MLLLFIPNLSNKGPISRFLSKILELWLIP